MSNANSRIILTIRFISKYDYEQRIKKWTELKDNSQKENALQECGIDEELIIYDTENRKVYELYRSTLGDGVVECIDTYENVQEDDFYIPKTESYFLKLDFDFDWISSEEISNVGLCDVVSKEVLDEIVDKWQSKGNKNAEKYLLLYSAGGSGPDINGEYDVWYDFEKWIDLREI